MKASCGSKRQNIRLKKGQEKQLRLVIFTSVMADNRESSLNDRNSPFNTIVVHEDLLQGFEFVSFSKVSQPLPREKLQAIAK